MSNPAEITSFLNHIGQGDADARNRLLAAIYDEIHRLAAAHLRGEAPNRTLQATALLHETFLRLFGNAPPHWENRAHFFASAAEVMRRLLVEDARRRRAAKRGGGLKRIDRGDTAAQPTDPATLLAVSEALDRLAKDDAQRAAIVKLRFYSGLSVAETAAALGLTLRTAEREWRFARAWLLAQLSDNDSVAPASCGTGFQTVR